MKLLVAAAFNCFLLAVIIGSAVGDEQAGATSNTAEHVCPKEGGVEGEEDLSFYLKVLPLFAPCYDKLTGNTSALMQDSNNTTPHAVQGYFHTMCMDATSFRECLEKKASALKVCSSLIQKTFNIIQDLMIKTVEKGCAEDGKLFVTLMKVFYIIEESRELSAQMQACTTYAETIGAAVEKSSVDTSSKFYIMLHTEFGKFAQCLSRIQFDQPLREGLDFYINELSKTMKCIHPQDGTLVPCASIDVHLISAPTVCEAKTHNSKLDVYDILENDAGRCFDRVVLHDTKEQDVTSDSAALREEVAEYLCGRRRTLLRTVNKLKTISVSCLNETQQNEFNVSISTINKGFDVACYEDGRRLADIMFEVYRLKRTGHGHAVWDCIDVAKSTRNVTDEHRSSSKNMRFYHEVEAFKGCIVNKLQGDQTSVDAATSLIDELLKNVECPGVEVGSTVTCKSLMVHHHHNHHHH